MEGGTYFLEANFSRIIISEKPNIAATMATTTCGSPSKEAGSTF